MEGRGVGVVRLAAAVMASRLVAGIFSPRAKTAWRKREQKVESELVIRARWDFSVSGAAMMAWRRRSQLVRSSRST